MGSAAIEREGEDYEAELVDRGRRLMKKLLVAKIVCAALFFSGCAQWQNIQQTLGTPAQVQADVAILGGVAKPHIPAGDQAKIHLFATQLNAAASLDVSQLVALIPHVSDPNAAALIAAGVAYVNAALAKWGGNNGTTLAYGHAVANGLLADF